MRILITGARGFVGSALKRSLSEAGHEVWGSSRFLSPESESWLVLNGKDFSPSLLEGIEVVIHAAGATPASAGRREDRPFQESIDLSRDLATAVKTSAVHTIIHLSSVAALGTPRELARGVVDDRYDGFPGSSYGRYKRAAEEALLKSSASDRLVVNLRMPLVFGPESRGSWGLLLRLVRSPLPLPFSRVRNRRSFLGIGNLAELIGRILEQVGRGELSGNYLAADREVVSLTEVCDALRRGLGRRAGQFPFPAKLMSSTLKIMGKADAAAGLFGDLVVDSSRTAEVFGWSREQSTLVAMERCLSVK